jgi:hypothetical protein
MRLNLYITYNIEYEKNKQTDLILRAKNTNILDLYFYDENDALINITGSEVYFMIKNKPSDLDASAVVDKKITSLTSPMNGNTTIELTSTDTASLIGNYIYSVKIKYDSKWYTVVEGNVCFKQNIISRES